MEDARQLLKPQFYGARQMVRHLRLEGVRLGRRRASRLMRLMGLQSLCENRFCESRMMRLEEAR